MGNGRWSPGGFIMPEVVGLASLTFLAPAARGLGLVDYNCGAGRLASGVTIKSLKRLLKYVMIAIS